jgi:hypothetical protein
VYLFFEKNNFDLSIAMTSDSIEQRLRFLEETVADLSKRVSRALPVCDYCSSTNVRLFRCYDRPSKPCDEHMTRNLTVKYHKKIYQRLPDVCMCDKCVQNLDPSMQLDNDNCVYDDTVWEDAGGSGFDPIRFSYGFIGDGEEVIYLAKDGFNRYPS